MEKALENSKGGCYQESRLNLHYITIEVTHDFRSKNVIRRICGSLEQYLQYTIDHNRSKTKKKRSLRKMIAPAVCV